MLRINSIPTGFFVAGTLLILLLGNSWQHAETERIRLETSVTGEQIVLRLQSCIDSRAALMHAFAAFEWDSTAQVLDEWPRRASSLFPLHSGILGLNFIDNDWLIRSVYPQSSNIAALGADLHQHQFSSVPAALQEAETTGTLRRTDLIELLQSGAGFALYQRISSVSGEPLGFANGVFRLDSLMESCFAEQPLRNRFSFSLQEGAAAFFYQQPASGYQPAPGHEYQQTFDVIGKPWSLRISPSPEYFSQQSGALPELETGLGIVLLLALSLLLRSYLLKQQQVAAHEKLYRLLVENQNDMVIEIDTAGNFLYASPSYCRMFGKSETELPGTRFLPQIHADDQDFTSPSLESLRQPPHSSYHEQRALTKDGWRWLAWSNTAVFNAAGEITAITAVGRDITDIRNLETRAAHAEKMQALGNMAGGISHDFNNILHVVQANIEFLMLDHPDDQGLQTELHSISQTVERAKSLVASLATLSRQDAVRKESIDLNIFVAEVLALLSRTLPPTIQLKQHTAAEPLQVKADKTQLEQVILNLCFNARDAIKSAGEISVEVSSCALHANGHEQDPSAAPANYACIRITDNGSGIAPEILSRIFEPFFTTKQKGSGTGLGLANCYSIIKQHFGEILVESEPGRGSVFTVYLPLRLEARSSPDVEAQATANAGNMLPASTTIAQSPQPRSSDTILVVDDDPEILRLTAALLSHAGYQTLLANNGEEALLRLKQDPAVALVLMDVMMPVLGGVEAAAQIHQAFPNVPVLLMSGYAPDVKHIADTTLLQKPFTRDCLLQTVDAVLADARAAC